MKEILHHICAQLETVYPADEAEGLAWWVVEEMSGLSRSQILTGCKGTINIPNVQEIIERLLHFEPVQYIFGHTLWCGLDLKVSPATLIPRPETAELVEAINKFPPALTKGKTLKILDIGTGSGCIAIALKKRHPQWSVTGIDISAEAVGIAQENARRNRVEVTFETIDIFSENAGFIGYFDLVVSNPPYICESEKKGMRQNVLDYEPAETLFVPDNDPLRFYRRIASLGLGRHLFFEINEAYARETSTLLEELEYSNIRVMHDIYGKARIISAGRHASVNQ